MEQTVTCLIGDPWEKDPRAAAVLHLSPDLLPKGWLESAADAAHTRDQDVEGLPEYLVICFGFNPDRDRVPLVMDGDRLCLIHDRRSAPTHDGAIAKAGDWVGPKANVCEFKHLPGPYQAAYHDWLTGTRWDSDPTSTMWVLPPPGPVPEGYYPVRPDFPHPPVPTRTTPNPDEVAAIALPIPVVDELFRQRGW
jgi:hypothetical protein